MPSIEDDIVELVAWAITEGNYRPAHRKGNGVCIAQKVERQRVASLMGRLHAPAGYTSADGCHRWELGGVLAATIREAAPAKVPTVDWLRQLTHRQLRLFIDVVMAGDGGEYVQPSRQLRRSVFQKQGDILDAIITACVLAGQPLSRAATGMGANHNVEAWTLRRSNRIEYRRLQPGPYIRGPVWCPETAYGTFVARRQGTVFITGNSYAGTSVRAGAKVLKQLGFIESYHWARKLWEVVEALLYEGPVVLGTDWFVKMSRPNKWNVMRARGGMQGGHAYLATGVHVPKQLIRIRNSWGTGWGLNGRAWIRFRDMKKLLKRQGEACLAKEVSKKTAMQQLRETCLNAEVAPPTAEAPGIPPGYAIPERPPIPGLPNVAFPIPEKPDDDCSPEPE